MLPKKTWSFLPLVTQTLTVMIMYKNSESTMTKKRALISKQSTRQNSVIALLHDLTTEKKTQINESNGIFPILLFIFLRSKRLLQIT